MKNLWKNIKCYENLRKSWKSMKINEMAASWNRANVSLGAGPRCHRAQQGSKPRTLGINEMQWKPMKIMKIYVNQWNSNQLESSKGYFRGKTSMPQGATGLQTSDPWNPWNLMKCYESLWKSCKSIKINEIATSWNRAKVSWGAGPRCHNAPQGSKPRTLGIHEISWNAMKTFENHKNLMK